MASADLPVDPSALAIEVAFSPGGREVRRWHLRLPAGATVGDALSATGIGLDEAVRRTDLHAAIWGRLCEPGEPLRDGDRVEVVRPLQVDPKEARRRRAKA